MQSGFSYSQGPQGAPVFMGIVIIFSLIVGLAMAAVMVYSFCRIFSKAGYSWAFGLLVLVYVVGRYLVLGSVVPGFAFLASIVAIFSGAQLLAIGIIGEYLARIHFRTMGRPPYQVGEETSAPKHE